VAGASGPGENIMGKMPMPQLRIAYLLLLLAMTIYLKSYSRTIGEKLGVGKHLLQDFPQKLPLSSQKSFDF
jgi:hypothetical protein